jgi:hypothetical protein
MFVNDPAANALRDRHARRPEYDIHSLLARSGIKA